MNVAPHVRGDGAISRVVVDLRVGETLSLGDDVAIKMISKSGKLARLLVCATRSVPLKWPDSADLSRTKPATIASTA